MVSLLFWKQNTVEEKELDQKAKDVISQTIAQHRRKIIEQMFALSSEEVALYQAESSARSARRDYNSEVNKLREIDTKNVFSDVDFAALKTAIEENKEIHEFFQPRWHHWSSVEHSEAKVFLEDPPTHIRIEVTLDFKEGDNISVPHTVTITCDVTKKKVKSISIDGPNTYSDSIERITKNVERLLGMKTVDVDG